MPLFRRADAPWTTGKDRIQRPPGEALPEFWPVTLQLAHAKRTEASWRWAVTVEIANTLPRALALDGPSVGQGSELRNDLFHVVADGVEVDYRGMMAKRAPPDAYVLVAPGATYRVDLDLSDTYVLPAATTQVTVRFEHRNHFSKDGFVLRSPSLAVVLPGGG